MSILSEPDYVLYLIRLQYLRRSRDPLGPTTITFPETYSPYVLHSDLTNPEVWPELALVTPAKPVGLSDLSPHSGGGALRYTDTIHGSASKGVGSGFGMRVRARKRTSWSAGRRARPSALPIGTSDELGRQARESSSSTLNTDAVEFRDKGKGRAIPDAIENDLDGVHRDMPDLGPLSRNRRLSDGSTSSRSRDTSVRQLSKAPPLVTIESPGYINGDINGEIATAMPATVKHNPLKDNRPAIVRTSSSEEEESANATAEDQSAVLNDVMETSDTFEDARETQQPSPKLPPDRRSRPVTLLHTPDYAHDKELSDAFRWQDDLTPSEVPDTVRKLDPSDLSLTSPNENPAQATNARYNRPRSPTSPNSILPPTTPLDLHALDGRSITSNSVTDQTESAVAASISAVGAGRLRSRLNSDASSLAPYDSTDTDATTPYRPKTEDNYDFMRAPSILEASSLAAQRLRARVKQKPSEPDLAALRMSPTKSLSMSRTNSASRVDPTDAPAPVSEQNTDGPAFNSAFARRRERRRVNISGKLALPLHVQQPAPLPAPSPPSRQSPSRPRAITDTLPASRAPSVDSRPRQGSLDQFSRSQRAAFNTQPLQIRKVTSTLALQNATGPPAASDVFSPRKLPVKSVASPKVSALTAMLKHQPSSNAEQNPFMPEYGALVIRSPAEQGLKLRIFFPHGKDNNQRTIAIDMKVRKDVTVEEVIGCALLKYWEEGKQPELMSDAEKQEWDGETYGGRLDPAAWNLRIVEDEYDGEVDDDFPALDRMLPVSSFSFSAFALVEASSIQAKANQVQQRQIHRRPSRVLTRPKMLHPSSQNSIAGSTSQRTLQVDDAEVHSPSDKMSNLTATYAAPGGTEVYLRIRIPMAGLEAVVSTVKVTTNTYLADVIDTICRKRKEHLKDAKDWALMLGDKDIVAPLDRTVESLRGNHNLRLVKKSQIANLLDGSSKQLANVNPSASIFKRLSEPAQPKYVSASDVTRLYRRFTVFRKHAMSLGRHERILCIDGEYLKIMHTTTDAGRTATYHIGNVVDCKQSKRVIGSFKILVYIQQDLKRYDFEAANPRQTPEIISAVAQARQLWKASHVA